jgi:hypothetical protein
MGPFPRMLALRGARRIRGLQSQSPGPADNVYYYTRFYIHKVAKVYLTEFADPIPEISGSRGNTFTMLP